MKFSVCIDSVFGEKANPLETLKILKDLGYTAFEFWKWWEHDLDALKAAQSETGLSCVALCTRFISLVEEFSDEIYIHGLKETIAVCKLLDCKTIISQVGNDTGEPRNIQRERLTETLKKCVPYLEESGIMLVIEPLNTKINHIGYFLDSSDEAFDITSEVKSDNIKVLFDIYHQSVMGENVTEQIEKNLDKIGHFHIATCPGRHELDESCFEVLKEISKTSYKKYVGFEYFPEKPAKDGLKEIMVREF